MRLSKPRASLGALFLVVLVAACGGTDPQQAFLQSMVPHHRSAVEMSAAAGTQAKTGFVRSLSGEITASQTEEIGEMGQIHERLFKAPLKPDMKAHSALGLSAEEAGMNHMNGAEKIEGKRPFDRAFVDEMVPHHEGAIRMAEAVLEETEDPQLRELAEGIVSAQRKEIAEMKRFRQREYGSAAVPGAGGAADAGHGPHSG